jgi:hypothetical protein
MGSWALPEKDLFDLARRYTLPVIANAHLQPRSCWTHQKLKLPSPRRGLNSVLDRVLYQRLKRERCWFQKVLAETRGLDLAAYIIECVFAQSLEHKEAVAATS